MLVICNICGSSEFSPYGQNPRLKAKCKKCGSLERHRAMHFVLEKNNLLSVQFGISRCLQLAPEKVTYDYLYSAYGSGYISADLFPENYPHAECLRLSLPDGFAIFPDNYFNLIVHNHVLEHIPGSFKLHIDEFFRILKPGGVMAFTIPENRIKSGTIKTVEGGEFLESDAERLKMFGQIDHYKYFGLDLLDYLKVKFNFFQPFFLVDDDASRSLRVGHNAFGVILYCVK